MADSVPAELLPTIMNLATGKANAFVRRYCLAAHEIEDVRSQLVLAFLSAWPQYDRSLASVRTFASRVMDKTLVSILRYRLAASRREQPIWSSVAPVSEWSCKNFHLDFERAIADLPPREKQTARLLLQTSTAEVAKKMRCSRQSIQLRKKRIQAALVAAGISSDYFSSAMGPE